VKEGFYLMPAVLKSQSRIRKNICIFTQDHAPIQKSPYVNGEVVSGGFLWAENLGMTGRDFSDEIRHLTSFYTREPLWIPCKLINLYFKQKVVRYAFISNFSPVFHCTG
jgi:hypothetical protein